jgi:ABC-type Zn uptake system ZnuABC Zn-binding protein ZnuA
MESVVSLVKRARVFFIVRDDLLAIFSLVNKFEKQAPEVKTILLENLHEQNEINEKNLSKNEELMEKLDKEAHKIKNTVLDLINKVKMLHEKHKFFAKPFVLNEKEYLKYVGKEMTELRELFTVYGINLD